MLGLGASMIFLLKYGKGIYSGFKAINMAKLKKYWKEATIIVLLIAFLAFGWWHSRVKADLVEAEYQSQMYQDALGVAESNYEQLLIVLETNNTLIDNMHKKNNKLEGDISDAQNKIDTMLDEESNIITVYEQTLPLECEAKFDWVVEQIQTK